MQLGPIIYIDDDEDDQLLLRQAIRQLGVPNQVRCFSDGGEVLTYLRTTPQKPFIILCDLNMPRLNGLELWQLIKQDEYLRTKAIPFVFFTTAASPEAIHQAYQGAVQGFYRKPTSYEKLMEQLNTILTYWRDCLHPNSLRD
jgi:CheY-like chemotaxis protein